MLLWHEENYVVSVPYSFRKHLLFFRYKIVIEDKEYVETNLGAGFCIPYV
jgi:hypothetical protein